MKGFAGSQDLCESSPDPTRNKKPIKTNNTNSKKDLAISKDDRHIPKWDIKIQREFEAKNPGPINRRLRKKTACITISDDEPEDQLGKMDDDWTAAIWDELVKDKPERWDLHDALRLGRTRCEDPSIQKKHRSRSSSPCNAESKEEPVQTKISRSFIDARDWEGKDLDRAINEGHLTMDQAKSIMKIRAAIGKGDSTSLPS